MQVNLAGSPGGSLGGRIGSRGSANRAPDTRAAGLKAYVTGPAPIVADMNISRRKTVLLVTRGEPRRHLHYAAPRLPFDRHRDPLAADRRAGIAGGARNRRIARPSRACRPYHLRRQPAGSRGHRDGNRLRHLLRRPISRGASSRRGSGNGFLHHFQQCRQGCVGFRFDDRRGGFLPQLHAAALFPAAGHSVRRRHLCRGPGRAHAGAGTSCGRKPFRPVRAEAEDHGSAAGGG